MRGIAESNSWAASPFPVLSSLLRGMIRFGQLTIIDARGRARDFGDHRTYIIAVKIERRSTPSVSFEFPCEKQAQ